MCWEVEGADGALKGRSCRINAFEIKTLESMSEQTPRDKIAFSSLQHKDLDNIGINSGTLSFQWVAFRKVAERISPYRGMLVQVWGGGGHHSFDTIPDKTARVDFTLTIRGEPG
ncbi:hypothetical protein BT69DRAFT_1118488 [Atractiella rhizophila]|nr:hypothetical protein BT69DRAFT_1118488 [Atractiella rhizophila]